MKIIISILCIVLITFSMNAQETMKDPLRQYAYSFENSIGLNMTRVNTNHTSFEVEEENFNFLKNDYLLTPDFKFLIGWLFHKDERKDIYSLRTGFGANVQRANLTDDNGEALRLITNYVSLPIDFQIRQPLSFRPIRKDLFRAISYGFGTYLAAPVYQKLDRPENVDASGKTTLFNYLRFGINSEISFSAYDQKGKGHKFGIRTSVDFNNVAVFSETDNELYPYYYNIGIFYNISNSYYKKKEKE